MGIDETRDSAELARLKIAQLDDTGPLGSYYREAAFELFDVRDVTARRLKTSWARRLSNNPHRNVVEWTARAFQALEPEGPIL